MSPLYTYNGKLLQQSGQLAISSSCCCGEGENLCCECYVTVGVVFGGAFWDPPFWWNCANCVVKWKDEAGNEEITQGCYNPPGPNWEPDSTLCTIALNCRSADHFQEFGYPLGGGQIVSMGEKKTTCRSDLDKEECERCRPAGTDGMPIDMFLDDRCGIWTPKSQNKICCEEIKPWPPDSCGCDKGNPLP